MKPIFIAEIKTKSPFGFESKHSFATLMECAIEHGDWISVHTNALWGGDLSAIKFVRQYTHKPILAKGFHTTVDDVLKAKDAGADYVLVIDQNQSWVDCLSEFTSFDKFTDCINRFQPYYNKDMKFVVNSRHLRTGEVKHQNELNDYLIKSVWVCQASNIETPEDVDKRVNAFIVGTHLIDFCKNRGTIGQ